MRKIFCLLLILSLINCGARAYAVSSADAYGSDGDFTYLILGLDDAGDNTDVMVLVRYTSKDNSVMLIQIPRDTYISAGTAQNKINQIYATKKNAGASVRESMSHLLTTLSSALGIKIDGYFTYTTKAFVSFIDGLSGIDVDMPFDLTLRGGENDIILTKGKNHLSGNEALSFVRYRKDYLMGDLGRIDAQKILISSVVKKFKGSANIIKLLMLLFNNKKEIYTNIKATDAFNIAMKNRGRMHKMRFEYLTLPGSSVKGKNGLWYFSANKYAVQSLYDKRNFSAEFDKGNVFCNFNSDEFKNIYYSKKITPKIYDDESLKDIRLRQNVG